MMSVGSRSGDDGRRDLDRGSFLPLILILAVGFFLRVWRIDAQPLRGDEGFSLVIWTKHFGDMFGELATTDPQPPLTLLWFFSWTKVLGATAFGGRIPSALASTVTIATAFALGKRLGSRRAGVFASLLMAFNPYAIWFAQDVRSGAFWTCLSGLGVLMMLAAFEKPKHRGKWFAYVLLTIAGLYTFYLEAFILVFQNLFVGFRALRERRFPCAWVIAQGVIMLAILPWYLPLALKGGSYSPTAGPVQLLVPFHSFLFGNTMPTLLQPARPEIAGQTPLSYLGLFLMAVALLMIWWKREDREKALFLTLYILVPLLLLASLEWITGGGYFRARYFLSSSVGWLVALGWGLDRLASSRLFCRQSAEAFTAAGLMTGILAMNLVGFSHYRSDPRYIKAPDLESLAADLASVVGDEDVIIYNGVDPTFELYYRDISHVVILPDPERDVAAHIRGLEESYRSLYFVPWPQGGWDDEQVVAAYLDSHLLLTASKQTSTYEVRRYDSLTAAESEITTHAEASFDDLVTLKGYEIAGFVGEDGISPGDHVSIILTWQPLARRDADLKVFVHLVGEPGPDGSPVRAQDDHPFQHGRIDPAAWQVGTIYRDVYILDLPADLPPGEYALYVGIYDPATSVRLSRIVTDLPLPAEGAVQVISVAIH